MLPVRRDGAVIALVTLDRVVKGLKERLGIGRAGNDAGMELRLAPFPVRLTEVEEEFESIAANLEVVRISTHQSLGVPAFTVRSSHCYSIDVVRLPPALAARMSPPKDPAKGVANAVPNDQFERAVGASPRKIRSTRNAEFRHGRSRTRRVSRET